MSDLSPLSWVGRPEVTFYGSAVQERCIKLQRLSSFRVRWRRRAIKGLTGASRHHRYRKEHRESASAVEEPAAPAQALAKMWTTLALI